MTHDDARQESFEEFKDSFSYGERTDLNFKFLKSLSNREAATFIQELLWKLGDSFNDGDLDRIVQHVYEGQIRSYSGAGHYTYEGGPFTPLKKPISKSRVVLITTSGHFVEGQNPEPLAVANMSQQDAVKHIKEYLRAAPQLSAIPIDTPADKLRVRHPGYDVRGALADPNVVFPLERIVELHNEGIIGDLSPEAYSFVGATSQTRLLKHEAPQWADMLKQHHIDAALLVPV